MGILDCRPALCRSNTLSRVIDMIGVIYGLFCLLILLVFPVVLGIALWDTFELIRWRYGLLGDAMLVGLMLAYWAVVAHALTVAERVFKRLTDIMETMSRRLERVDKDWWG